MSAELLNSYIAYEEQIKALERSQDQIKLEVMAFLQTLDKPSAVDKLGNKIQFSKTTSYAYVDTPEIVAAEDIIKQAKKEQVAIGVAEAKVKEYVKVTLFKGE